MPGAVRITSETALARGSGPDSRLHRTGLGPLRGVQRWPGRRRRRTRGLRPERRRPGVPHARLPVRGSGDPREAAQCRHRLPLAARCGGRGSCGLGTSVGARRRVEVRRGLRLPPGRRRAVEHGGHPPRLRRDAPRRVRRHGRGERRHDHRRQRRGGRRLRRCSAGHRRGVPLERQYLDGRGASRALRRGLPVRLAGGDRGRPRRRDGAHLSGRGLRVRAAGGDLDAGGSSLLAGPGRVRLLR